MVQFFKSQSESEEPSQPADEELERVTFSTPISHDKGQEQAFLRFIETHDHKLKNLDFSRINYTQFMNNISHVFEQCYRQKLCFGDKKYTDERIAPYLPKV